MRLRGQRTKHTKERPLSGATYPYTYTSFIKLLEWTDKSLFFPARMSLKERIRYSECRAQWMQASKNFVEACLTKLKREDPCKYNLYKGAIEVLNTETFK